MKKVSLTLIAVLMLISLVSCKKSDNNPEPVSGTLGKYTVTIENYVITKDAVGKDAVIINFKMTNNSDKEAAFLNSILPKVSQNGVQLDNPIFLDNKTYDGNPALESIKPGQTLKVQLAYALQDTKTPINVELREAANIAADAPKVTQTFNIG